MLMFPVTCIPSSSVHATLPSPTNPDSWSFASRSLCLPQKPPVGSELDLIPSLVTTLCLVQSAQDAWLYLPRTRISELWCRAAMRALVWPSLPTLGLASCSKAICFHRCIFVVLSLTHSSQLNLFRSSSLTSSLFLPSRSSRKRLLLLADRSGACGTSRPSPLSFLDPPPLSL